MKIKVLGFNWKYSDNNFDELRAILDADSARRMKLLRQSLEAGKVVGGWDGTIFTVTDYKKCWVGVVLKVRDQKRFCQVSSADGKLKLTAEDLADGSKMVEVNFFFFNPARGNGIYQYYHQSTWVARFNHLCSSIVGAHCIRKHDEIGQRGNSEGWTTKQIHVAKQAENRELACELVIKKEQFEELIKTLKQVKKVTIRAKDDSLARTDMGAISENANRMALTFSYSKDSAFSQIKKSIVDYATENEPWRLRVEGILADGSAEIVNLISNKEFFDECEFDDVSKGMEVDLLDPAALITGSEMGKRIISSSTKPRVALMLGLS